MATHGKPGLTELIRRARLGDAAAADQLFAVVYDDLRRLARARLRGRGRNVLLDTSALVHESYLRFAGAARLELTDRAHFMRWAGRVMRSVIMLINDYATFLSRLNEHTEAEALQREGLDIAVRFSAARRWLWRTCSTTSQ